MSAEAHAPTASEYIVHHLTHWQSGKMGGIVDLSVFNIDSLIFSITLGVLGCFFLWQAARKATSGVGVDDFCLDFPAECHGFVAAGSAANDLAKAFRTRACLPAQRAYG